MNDKKALSAIGLAQKSGNVGSGEFLTEQTIREERAKLVIVAQDASDNTKKKFRNMCEYRNVPLAIFGNKDQLGMAIGKEFRASLVITDAGLAKLVGKNLDLEVE